jgi:hypothetical protein
MVTEERAIMTKKRTVDVPFLGKMTEEVEELWEGEVTVPGFEEPWRVYVDGDEEAEGEEAIPRTRRAMIEKFLKTPDLRRRMQEWLLEYYDKAVVTHIRPQKSPKEAALHAPVLERPEQIWDLVSDIAVSIPPEDEEADVKLSGNCVWDEEHGFGFDVRGAKMLWPW